MCACLVSCASHSVTQLGILRSPFHRNPRGPSMKTTNTQTVLTVARTWDGAQAAHDDVVWIALERDAKALMVDIRATRHGDAAPTAVPGRCERLWDYEVVEVFIAGPGDKYLELEFGPDGHYLALTFDGFRNLVSDEHTLDYNAVSDGSRWRGMARVPLALLPEGPFRINAFAINGPAEARRHFAAYPGTGSPDFHRVDNYVPTPL